MSYNQRQGAPVTLVSGGLGFTQAQAVTPSDSTTYDPPVVPYVGGTGDLVVVPVGGSTTVKFTAVQAGTLLPVRCSQVMSTNTTATNVVGLS